MKRPRAKGPATWSVPLDATRPEGASHNARGDYLARLWSQGREGLRVTQWPQEGET